jgi:hypothetical protein
MWGDEPRRPASPESTEDGSAPRGLSARARELARGAVRHFTERPLVVLPSRDDSPFGDAA